MAKNTKKPTVNHGKPITSFFARSSKPSSSQDKPRSSAETTSPTKKPSSSVDNNTSKLNVFGINSEGVSKTPTKNVTPLSSSSSRQTPIPNTSQVPVTPSSNSSLKRPRSPDSQSPCKPTKLSERRSQHPDVEMTSKTVSVNSMTTPQTRKKARISSSDEESQAIIPSSQSDEEELTLSSSVNPKPLSTKSQNRPIPLTPEGDDESDKMVVDPECFTELDKDTVAMTKQALSDKGTSRSVTDQMLTPPSSDLLSIPPTPRHLDPEQKIAELRAAVFAETALSPESPPMEFKEELDSSSDEEEVSTTLTKQTKKTGRNPDSSLNEPAKPALRYSLRNRSLPSPSDGSRRKTSTNQPVQNKNTSPTRASARNKGQKAKSNPFAALLREKRAADKHGVGDDAFRLAEMTALRLKNKDPLGDMDLDEEDEVDWDAATRSARDMQSLFQETSSSSKSGANDSLLKGIDEEERKTFLGAIKGKGNGKGLVDILEKDKVGEREAVLLDKKPGIQFWSSLNHDDEPADVENGMMDNVKIPLPQLPGDDATVRLYNTSLQCNDLFQAKLLFDMDFMHLVSSLERSVVASSICELALSPQSTVLGSSATRVLEKFWSSSSEPMNSAISFAQIKKAMLPLGAEPSVFITQKWSVPSPGYQLKHVQPLQRATTISRLIRLIESCARSQRLAKSDVSNIIIALLLLGMDSEVSPDLLEDVTRVVDLTCNCVPTDDIGLAYNICVKILRCAESYGPMNKARLISILSAGTGITRKVASVVAHCFITDKQCPKKESVFGLPPLLPIIDQLIPDPGTPGKFTLYEQTNYDDIGHYIFILGVAVSNIKEYVIDERSPMSRAIRAEAATKFGEKPQTDLQVVRSALEGLHNKISDTRAAHLERSRAKAAIKMLSMAIHYQREHCIRNDPDNQTKSIISDYFTKKDK